MKRYSILPPLPPSDDLLVFAIMPPVEDQEENEPTPSHNCMVRLDGAKQSFRCACGCNVFQSIGPGRYQCNSCGETYTGE